MSPVIASGAEGWVIKDEVEGITLSTGMALLVQWPDGFREGRTVHVETTQESISEMGQPVQIYSRRSYFVHEVHGAKVRVYLRGNPEILVALALKSEA